MRILSILLILILANAIYSLEIDKIKRMSFASDFQMNSTIVRHKRYLDFIPKSRMFVSNSWNICPNGEFKSENCSQFRANIKANVLSANQVLAFAYGFRANYPIENDIRIRRRDVYDSMEELIDQWVFGITQIFKQIDKFLCLSAMDLMDVLAFRNYFAMLVQRFQTNRECSLVSFN